jgi:[ribosomal protein S5]-alanine N-acetyltransferase
MFPIESARCILRRLKTTDLAMMLQLETDPDIVRFTPSRFPLSEKEIQVRLSNWIKKEESYSPLGMWMVEAKKDNTFIGWFMLIPTDLTYPELGFMITKREWGKGYATEVSTEILRHAFDDLKISAVSARTDSDNHASIKVLEKLGFKFLHTKIAFDEKLKKDVVTNIYEK